MPRTIATYVKLTDDQGLYVSNQPGDSVPDHHAKLITNPAVWGTVAPAEPNALVNKEPKLADMSNRSLLALGKDAGLEFSKSPRKGDTIEALEAAKITAPAEATGD